MCGRHLATTIARIAHRRTDRADPSGIPVCRRKPNTRTGSCPGTRKTIREDAGTYSADAGDSTEGIRNV
jgi:hypothetical protein